MKNLITTFKACSLILLLAFASCKKDGGVKTGTDPHAPVTANDILGYSIPISLSSDEGLRIIYFNKDGNDVKATFDAVSARRVFTVNVVDNIWTLDLNGDGSVIYTFTFGRFTDNGGVTLFDASYKKQNDASIKMNLVIVKNADIPPFANQRFAKGGNGPLFLKFSNDHNFAISPTADYAGAGWTSYYDLCPGAWKGTYNGVNYMGVSVKLINNDPVEMIVQKAGEAKTYTFNPLNN